MERTTSSVTTSAGFSKARPLTPEEFRALAKPKRSKYGVGPKEGRTYGGRVYDSVLECRYAQQLDVWKAAGAVSTWTPQIVFVLHAKGGEPIGKYWCDFRVWFADGHSEFVECKGVDLPLGKWKRKHCEAEYGVKVTLVKKVP
jgi:hypothetical protein